MKKSRIAAWALATVMAVSTATAYVPANAAVKVNKVTVASSLSGNKKTVVVAKGKSVKLATTVKVKPNKKANKKVSYSVKDKKIATVNGKGVVKGNKVGTTKVTVTSAKNKKKKATITVKVVKAAVKKVTVNKKKASLNVGQTLKLKTTVKAGKGANKTIAFTTSKKKVATVNKKGVITAVGTGSAVITAKAIDGSGKKATCKVKVANPINLAAMNVLNERSVTFALDKALALTADQISIKSKMHTSGTYNHALKINNMTTADNVNYTIVLDNDSYISVGDFVQVSIPALTGTVKSLEMEYKEQVCAFTGEQVSAWAVGTYRSTSFDFGQAEGYSSYAISAVPAGLAAEVKGDSVVVKGVPTTPGALDATLTAVDELGNTLTKTIHFIVGDDNTIVGAGCQEYVLYGTEAKSGTRIYLSNYFTGGGVTSYVYSVTSDPYNIVTNKDQNGRVPECLNTRFVAAGTFSVTVRATSYKDPSKFAEINIVFNVKQGIVVGGALKDAQGNPMPYGTIKFTNKDRATHYNYNYNNYYYMDSPYETYVTVDPQKSTYSAVLEPGTYDIQASYSAGGDANDYTLSTKYLYAQQLAATATGYDIQLDNIYKVVLPLPENDSRDWYFNHVKVSKNSGSFVYLKNGTYTLESDEWDENAYGQPAGDWFKGTSTLITMNTYKYTTAPFAVNGAGVVVPVSKAAINQKIGNDTTSGAKNTTYQAYVDKYYDLEDTNDYNAYYFIPSETGVYGLDNASVYFYDSVTGNPIAKNEDGDYALTAGTKYIVSDDGEGDYSFKITKKVKDTTDTSEQKPENTDPTVQE